MSRRLRPKPVARFHKRSAEVHANMTSAQWKKLGALESAIVDNLILIVQHERDFAVRWAAQCDAFLKHAIRRRRAEKLRAFR